MVISTLFQRLQVEPLATTRGPGGRITNDWTATGISVIGALSTAGQQEQDRFQQDEHDQIYALSTNAPRYPNAKPNDRLRDVSMVPNRLFYMRGLDDDSSNRTWCTYYLSLRPSGA